ncbi:ecto-NOX disulfide-thiol exchanger 1 isoform X1 [Mus musculus]|uniref:Ecto-NOX disulfide-thiol exchanger 1 n=2 Tax=Mus TaxID=862507 RepID=A0A8C6HSP9_MUSSI|nr:ecto-NOX disulfide-thiol exchanger 1 isoform 1 [Mus musculus]XP_006519062.1 ecto-NOX disulfide-thiol exchanger 1 isoform X1 [Mus musculus]XP_006519063.1 ecto-NOX disulfide-thiol exchanger 1 isoform X1 [Mus musculus]XP_006519064.1 ecto-NOX disulfide-thiol exchanger 1 isoform X1 [Mus musculus]XP_011243365.1 ecto-NOX disulfide-thiol exchanger 1 isoform X1 [Mus musculus]XP_011243366.1 ecto-NOX disulfide-thiol exchanger 1 isoform X1 [Mus musculus]XP_030103660.1 ecto-NOX disulfide-thiol exchange|eukprot:NP_001240688.1 ecto-NOX disulfide-thiol exchanger 1 isoform 1 [Mus musculus]
MVDAAGFESVAQCPRELHQMMAAAADGLGSIALDTTQLNMSVTDPTAWATAMNNLGMVPVGLPGQQLVSDSICVPGFDPGLNMMTGITPINPMIPGLGLVPPPPPTEVAVVKEIIHCKSCTLFPQNPNLPPPSTRERPPGCKTVFVGGLPENATEEIIQEVFEQCGDITAIRKSKKNFCHIRFAEEFMVDKAIYLSGYRMRLGSSTDKKDSGRLHVDFAQARDDFYEWECKQRMRAREERHRRKLEEDRLRPPSPPAIMHYSEHEAALLADKLKDDSKFSEAITVLLSWIERGEVNRRSANQFYSMVQSANSHVRRLMNEKATHEQEMEEAKENFKNALTGILTQFEQIVAVFNASTRQKAWDHFSKAQRKNIDIWRKHSEELRNAQSEQLMGIRREEEMEMSDDENCDSPTKKMRVDESEADIEDCAGDPADRGLHSAALAAQAYALKEENDSLRWQLDAYRNEVELLKQEKEQLFRTEENLTKDQQLQFLQQTMQGMQQQLLAIQEELNNKKSELEQAKEEQSHTQALLKVLQEQLKGTKDLVETNGHSHEDANEINVLTVALVNQDRENNTEKRSQGLKSEKEALLIGIISTFLHVHPFGANIEYLWSYMQQLDSKISANEIEMLLMRLPRMFKQEFTGVGATLEKRWKLCAFEGIKTT